MTLKGKYILGSPSSTAVLARYTTFKEPKNATMVTPPTQDTGCMADKTAVLLKRCPHRSVSPGFQA